MDDEDEFLQQLKTKMERYFKKQKCITKKEDLDNFLAAVDLLEFWNSNEEKEVVWQCLNKYNKKGKIDYNSALNGIRDLINQEEDPEGHEQILERLSRRASVRNPQKDKVPIHKLRQIAIDEYECVDNDTLFQLKKIISLLKANKDTNRIFFSKVQEICAENKFIKIRPEEIWKYMSFLSTDNHEGKTNMPMTLHQTLLNEIEKFLNEKIPYDELDTEIEEKKNDDDGDDDDDIKDPLEIIDKIINSSESIEDDSNIFIDMTKSLANLADTMVEKAQNILTGNDNSLEESLFVKDLMIKKINELKKHNSTVVKKQKKINKKMEKIQFFINKKKNDYQNLVEDYKVLNEKYENNQKTVNNNDEALEKLYGENLMLCEDKEAKEKEIETLNEEKKDLENKYSNLYSQLEQSLNKNKEIQNEINDVTRKSIILKADYEDTLKKLVNLEKEYNQEMLKKEEREKVKEEEDEDDDDFCSGSSARQSKGKFNPIPDPRKSQAKSIHFDDEENEEKFLSKIKELEKENEILSEKNKDSAMKIKEFENMVKNYSKGNMDVIRRTESNISIKLNDIFHPTSFEIFNERMCLLSNFNNFNPKKNKIVKKFNFSIGYGSPTKKNIIKNSNPILSKENSVEINYNGIVKEYKKQQTFNNSLNIIFNNSSFNIEMKKKENLPKKPTINFEIIHNNDIIMVGTINKIMNTKEYQIVNNSFNIIKELIAKEKIIENKEYKIEKNSFGIIKEVIAKENKIEIKEYKIEKNSFVIIKEVIVKENKIEKKEYKIEKNSFDFIKGTIKKEYKIVKNSFNIIKKISIVEKRNELNENANKNNGLDDILSTKKSANIAPLQKTTTEKEDEFIKNFFFKDMRSNTIMINPKDLVESKDYYCLFQEEVVRRKLAQLKDNCCEKNIYTDQIYVLVERKSLLKKYILLTPTNFCIIDKNTLKFIYIDKIKNIKNVVLSKLNLNMILFRFEDGEDVLIESLRAYDLILYLKNTYFSNSKESKFRYEDKFIIKLKGYLHSLVVTDKILTNLLYLDGAVKVGYLSLYKGTLFSSTFVETVGVLTHIGLIILEESTLRPMEIIPILGSITTKVEKERFGNNNCFEIILPSGINKVFAVRKVRDRESWLAQFSKLKKEYELKMKRIGVTKKAGNKMLQKLKGGK